VTTIDLTRWPAQRIEMRARASLRAYDRNSRTHSPEQVAQIAASIREWGWTMPVLVTPEGEVIAGHGRLMAAETLGIDEVPCMVAANWSEAQKRAYVMADNQIALNAGWDEEVRAAEMAFLRSVEFDIDVIGFSDDELAKMLNATSEPLTDPDDVPDVIEDAPAVSREGDVWLLGAYFECEKCSKQFSYDEGLRLNGECDCDGQ
jgi:ParB-like chromosome segregation protein Spo0J